MADRYFVDNPITTSTVMLTGDEARHVSSVMRAAVGDRLVLFDGSGAEFDAEISNVGKRAVELIVLARREVDRESPVRLTLAVALPKGDRQRWLVEKAVELGAARIVPMRTARSVAQPTDSACDRLRRAVIEASKQCGRARLLEIGPPTDLARLLDDDTFPGRKLIAHPHESATPLAEVAAEMRGESNSMEALVAIGPEGGFSDEEFDAALAAGFTPLSLGRRILRVETAAVVIAAVLCGS